MSRRRRSGRTASVGVALMLVAVTAPLMIGVTPIASAAQMCNGLVVTIVGTDGDDVLTGTGLADVIHGSVATTSSGAGATMTRSVAATAMM